MAKLLEGKVAALTGATSGIGRAIAIAFVKHGARVAVNHYPDEKSSVEFEEMRKELGEDAALIAVAGDVCRPETGQELIERTVSRFGRLDVSHSCTADRAKFEVASVNSRVVHSRPCRHNGSSVPRLGQRTGRAQAS